MLTNTDTTPSLSQTSLSICSRFGNKKQQNCNQKKKNKNTQTDVAASDTTEEDEEEANEGEETEDSGNEQEYKVDISKYSTILKVHTKLTVKATRRGKSAAKLSNKEFNALTWNGMERYLQTQSIEPKIDNLWNALFAEGTSTTLQTLMIRVNENKATTPVNKKLTKKHFFDELSLESGTLDAAGTDALDI
jgi:hypothetical protein